MLGLQGLVLRALFSSAQRAGLGSGRAINSFGIGPQSSAQMRSSGMYNTKSINRAIEAHKIKSKIKKVKIKDKKDKVEVALPAVPDVSEEGLDSQLGDEPILPQ